MTKTIFITGASTGLGKATALLFAEKGWNVVATMRNPATATDLAEKNTIRLMQLDVTDLTQIESVTAQVLKDTQVDVVFNNAGYGLAGPLEGTTDEQIRREIDTNLLGVLRVTKSFIPHFRTRKSGLFITTTSVGGWAAFPFNSVYHATKWGLEGWSESLWYELSKFNIGVKTVSPGGISTDFSGRSLVMTAHAAYTKLTDRVLSVFMNPQRIRDHSTPEEIAQAVYRAATDGKKKLRYPAGRQAKIVYAIRRFFGYALFMKRIDRMFFGTE